LIAENIEIFPYDETDYFLNIRIMKLTNFSLLILSGLLWTCSPKADQQLDLSGNWHFKIDTMDVGIEEHWYSKLFPEIVYLPGSMAENGQGEDISINTEWTGSIVDRSWFTEEKFSQYRQEGNMKIPFWLQPDKHYIGAAWYQKEIEIPSGWKGKYIELYLERPHWETQVWVDDQKAGMRNNLGTAHVYDLTNILKTGQNLLSIRVDNRIKEINPGINSHSISDHTQSNWNGIVGEITLRAKPQVFIESVKLYPDVSNKEIQVSTKFRNISGSLQKCRLSLNVSLKENQPDNAIPGITKEIEVEDNAVLEIAFPMGNNPKLWDEFHPNVYTMSLSLESSSGVNREKVDFGMREFKVDGQRFTINGRHVFLRGTVECAVFPRSSYPSTDMDEWERIFSKCKAHGLNHMRFHSWCPPEAAFEAADNVGIYLHVECSSWANQGSSIGDGKPIDNWLYQEAESIINVYGNHPSFCMMAYGNEPAGENQVKFLTDFVNNWKSKDPRRAYTGAAAWPYIEHADYYLAPEARIQGWGQELNSIINNRPPQTMFDYYDIINKIPMPYVSHEIGQWCVYPNFKEIDKYTGILKARNFEIFRESLAENHMAHLADSFLLASGKLQVLGYKADIEAALRTKNFAGFQLLQLNDFPGQGTALVGVLDPFWEEKGYVSPEEFRRFCDQTVPLVRLAKRIFYNNETFETRVEVAHFGEAALDNISPSWTLKGVNGETIAGGTFPEIDIPIGNGTRLGDISVDLAMMAEPRKLILTVEVAGSSNSWDLWVFPADLTPVPGEQEIKVVSKLDTKTIQYLETGGKVLLTPKKGSLRSEYGGDVGIGFSSIFWNTAWTNGQKPHTLGILCNPEHPALAEFPTEYHSNWQWWDAMSHSNTVILDSFLPELKPIVRVIDDWFTNRRLALIFEIKVGEGKLILSGIDLLSDFEDRIEAQQLLYSLKKYMASDSFDPDAELAVQDIIKMFK
jgi:hypothetical protein